MEEAKRAEKLSAARRMLKDHQKKSKKQVESELSDSGKSAADVRVSPASFEPSNTASQDSNINASLQSIPNVLQDVDSSSLASSKGSSTNNVSLFFSQSESVGVPPAVDAQTFFDQISHGQTYNGFPPVNNSNPSTNLSNPPANFNNGYLSECVSDVRNQSLTSHGVNSQNYSDILANYHQYYNLYNDAVQKIQWYEQQLESTKSLGEQHLKKAVDELQEKIQFQCRSIEMVLSEKCELQVQLDTVQEQAKIKDACCEELTNRLKASRNHVGRLEKELADIQEARMQHNSILKRLETNVQEQKITADRFRSELEEAKQEVEELKKSLDSAGSEYALLEKKMLEKESQLSLALIKIQQLGGENPQTVVSQSAQAQADIEALNHRIADLVKENEQSSLQYQEYINNLNSQLLETTSMYESVVAISTEQMTRIASLVEHVSDLEKQIQKYSSNIPQSADLIERNNQLKSDLEKSAKATSEMESELKKQNAKLEEVTNQLVDSRNDVSALEDRFERLSGEVPDAKLLQAAMESDKVAAARAISQNNQLKQQLQEIQDAYIKLQNNKLDLTEQLDLTKKQCLELQGELSSYIKKEVSRSDGSTEMNQVSIVDGCCQTTYYDLEAAKTGPAETVTPEAAALLEDKFRSTMNKLAQVLEEKQFLEHLVTKLQSETETIGEYVALYQMQRSKLEKREYEKDQIVETISKEKEELRTKLAEITSLIPSLLQRESRVSIGEEAAEDSPSETKSDASPNEAATKIISLLSEIGTSTLVKESIHPEDCTSNFHPCALCSGSLITV